MTEHLGGFRRRYLGSNPLNTNHLPDIPDPASSSTIGEKIDLLAIFEVATNCLVAPDELHVSTLTFSGVEEDPVVGPTVGIAILFALFAGKDEDEILVGRRADATLGLAAVLVVEVATTIELALDEHGIGERVCLGW